MKYQRNQWCEFGYMKCKRNQWCDLATWNAKGTGDAAVATWNARGTSDAAVATWNAKGTGGAAVATWNARGTSDAAVDTRNAVVSAWHGHSIPHCHLKPLTQQITMGSRALWGLCFACLKITATASFWWARPFVHSAWIKQDSNCKVIPLLQSPPALQRRGTSPWHPPPPMHCTICIRHP